MDNRIIIIDSAINDSTFSCADRYTAIIDMDYDSALAMSAFPFHPQGIGMHVSVSPEWVMDCIEQGQAVTLNDVPEQVQKCIMQDIDSIDRESKTC